MDNEISDEQSVDDFLERDIPLPTDLLVNTIGEMGRQLRLSLVDRSDFPLPVEVQLVGGRTFRSTLKSIYCDGSSQADGTFYFTDKVRDDGKKFFWGHEIATVTIQSE